ncbi:hypothetical protein KRP22_014371 [Phytophthora ramorum]|nr:hypothetical protein KRP22_9025 [Phytophthora ramorum]
MRPLQHATRSLDSLVAAWIGDPDKIQAPQPQPQPQDSDDVLRAFLQEMAELDQQPPPSPTRGPIEAIATKPRFLKRQAPEPSTPPAKRSRKPSAQPPAKPQAPATRWQRQKLELGTLKEHAETLGNYVAFLRKRQVPGLSIQLPPELEQLVQLQTTGWQAAAFREIRRCQAARQDNAELKQRLQACVQASGTLQTALNAAESLRREQLARGSIASRALQVEVMLDLQHRTADSARVFNMLEQSVNARVDEIQAVVSEVSQPVLTANTERVSICRKDETHPAVAFRTVRVLPFDAALVSNVCWQVAELGWKIQGSRVVRRSKDVVSSDWRFPVELEKGETVEIRVRCVAKRFVVPEGTVVLAESWTEWPAHLAASGTWSRVTRESGWGLVHSFPDNGADSSPACVSRFMMHMTSEPAGLDSDTSRRLLGSAAVSDIVIPSFRRLIRNRQQCVDNRLMDAAFAQGSAVSAI